MENRKHFVAAGNAIAIEIMQDSIGGNNPPSPAYAFESEPEYADYLKALAAAYEVSYEDALAAAREGFKTMAVALNG